LLREKQKTNTLFKKKYSGKETDKLGWDVHFWLGKNSSQDEIGVAAYKAVELDDLLDDGPVQWRETQENESALFQSYFKALQYLEGGIASGFRTVKPEEYKPRLFHVKRTAKTVRATEVSVAAKSLNHGDVFVLDAGKEVYLYIGEHSNAFEKMKGGALAQNIVSARQGKSKFIAEPDEKFWKTLGGTEKDVQPAIPDDEKEHPTSDTPVADKCVLWHLSDASGKMEFKKVHEGKVLQSMFKSDDVFILDANVSVFVWIGKGASQAEKSQAMKVATEYLKNNNKPLTTPVMRIMEGQIHHVFGSLIGKG
jgi:gelsolin